MKVAMVEITFPTTRIHNCLECGDPVTPGTILINGFCLDCIYYKMIDQELAAEEDPGEHNSDSETSSQ